MCPTVRVGVRGTLWVGSVRLQEAVRLLFSLGCSDQLTEASRGEPPRSDRASAIVSGSVRYVVRVGVRGTVRRRAVHPRAIGMGRCSI